MTTCPTNADLIMCSDLDDHQKKNMVDLRSKLDRSFRPMHSDQEP